MFNKKTKEENQSFSATMLRKLRTFILVGMLPVILYIIPLISQYKSIKPDGMGIYAFQQTFLIIEILIIPIGWLSILLLIFSVYAITEYIIYRVKKQREKKKAKENERDYYGDIFIH